MNHTASVSCPKAVPADLCPHFGECGGCRSQNVPYADQLAAKEENLRELFQAFWTEPVPITPSPDLWYYRNRLDFSFGPKYYPEPPPKGFERETVLGFKRKGRWYWPLEIRECRIGSPEVAGLLGGVRAWAQENSLRAFDSRTGKGFLKVLLVREGKQTGQRMVVLVTRPGELDGPAFVSAVTASYPADSVQWAVHHGRADVATGDEVTVLHGSAAIEEKLRVSDEDGVREIRFRISPFSFFQTNTLGAEVLYSCVRAMIQQIAPKLLYDLYGGTGGFALTCADLVPSVISVESVDSATADSLHNAWLNGIANIDIVTQPVQDYLRDLLETGGMARDSAVIMDPPRAGLHPKALKRLVELRPPEIVYVSCKPSVLAQELPALLQQEYRLRELCGVDLFPHTEHVEVVARLTAANGLLPT